MNRRRLAFAIASIATLVVAPAALSTSASAAQPARSATAVQNARLPALAGGAFQIFTANNQNLCMTVAEDNPLRGAEIDMEPCVSGRSGQTWTFGPNGWIQPAVGTNLCLDDRWNNPGGGAGASTYPCTVGWRQESWSYDGSNDIVNSNGNCLDITDNNPNPGAVVKLFPCVGVSNQHWLLRF